MTEKIENILFDLDGTLTDPGEGIINSILYALKKLGIEEHSINELHSFIGPPLRESFLVRYQLTQDAADNAVRFYREYYSEIGIYENILYPGMDQLLALLYKKSYRLYVATSKPTVFAEKIISHFNLSPYFTAIIGSNLDHTRTDKTEIITHVVSVYSLDTSKTVMVGDRKHDIIGANNNSLKSVGVLYGYGTYDELVQQQPDYIVNNCKELENLLLQNGS